MSTDESCWGQAVFSVYGFLSPILFQRAHNCTESSWAKVTPTIFSDWCSMRSFEPVSPFEPSGSYFRKKVKTIEKSGSGCISYFSGNFLVPIFSQWDFFPMTFFHVNFLTFSQWRLWDENLDSYRHSYMPMKCERLWNGVLLTGWN